MTLPPRSAAGGVRLQDDTTLPAEFRDPAVMAYLGALLARPDEPPPMPRGVTAENLPALIAKLDDPAVRLAVVRWLSKLLPS